MGGRRPKRTPTGSEPNLLSGAELRECWTAPGKTDLVLRLLPGEALHATSQPTSSPGNGSSGKYGMRGLKSRGEPEECELTLARTRIGGIHDAVGASRAPHRKDGLCPGNLVMYTFYPLRTLSKTLRSPSTVNRQLKSRALSRPF